MGLKISGSLVAIFPAHRRREARDLEHCVGSWEGEPSHHGKRQEANVKKREPQEAVSAIRLVKIQGRVSTGEKID